MKSTRSSETPSEIQSYRPKNSGMWPPGNSWPRQSRPMMGSCRWKTEGCHFASCSLSNWVLLVLASCFSRFGHRSTGKGYRKRGSRLKIRDMWHTGYPITNCGFGHLNYLDSRRQMASYIKIQGKWRLLNCTNNDAADQQLKSSAYWRIITILHN
jgi:hypothetical protein